MGSHISENAAKSIKEEVNNKDPDGGDIQVKLEELNSIHSNEKIIKERKLKRFLIENRLSNSKSIGEESRDSTLTPSSSSKINIYSDSCNSHTKESNINDHIDVEGDSSPSPSSSSGSNSSSSSTRRKSDKTRRKWDKTSRISRNNTNNSSDADDFREHNRLRESLKNNTNDSYKINSENQFSKNRSAKVEWSNSVMNHEHLFTLDSHVASEPLNYYTGFVPLVTGTANAIITSENDGYLNYSKNNDHIEIQSDNDDKINDKNGDIDVEIDYWHGEEISPINHSGNDDVNNNISILKISSDIGNGCKEGSYVGHKIVTDTNCNNGIENHRILQIQTTACGGFQPAPSLKVSDDRKDFDSNRLGSDSDDSMCVQAGNRIKENKEIEDNTFEGDFQYDYYDNNNSSYTDMKISINKGPALTLMDKCLDIAASSNFSGLTGAELKAIPQGPGRRAMIDDVTIMVLTF
jgi:hypothetical protein